ncbi:MAG: amidohydrolase family protein [Deltaproteobacteria bacterium]
MAFNGQFIVDSDGHGGEPHGWRKRIPAQFKSQMLEYIAEMKATFTGLPGGGMQTNEFTKRDISWPEDPFEFDVPTRPGVREPAARIEDMDEEGIDVAVLYPPGAGEEFALDDEKFAVAICQTLNDARAEYASHDSSRIKMMIKLPMMNGQAAAEELQRCVEKHPDIFVGLVTATHIQNRELIDPEYDPIWAMAEKLDIAVCTHGGGQAPRQTPILVDRYNTRLEKHAITHPVGAMQAVSHFTVGGILARHPKLRVGFMEAAVGWLPFWLERLDEHWEHMPEQAPAIDKAPSEYFKHRCFLTTEPEEAMVPYVSDSVGNDIICYASDYLHWDCAFPNSVKDLIEREDIRDDLIPNLFCNNAARLYNIKVPAKS